ncbi:UNVERIFIED_CONTAM: hypothetical protein GTU68_035715 [Idotea baltica]|nr:hypothetical protein [Idotea baltica]
MKFNVFETEEQVIDAFTAHIVSLAVAAIKARGQFNLSLSGGSSPKKVYELLASSVYRDQVDWNKVFFFFGDERYVPSDSPDSNALMVKEALFKPLGIEAQNIFAVDTSLPADEAADQYAKLIQDHFGHSEVRFDCVMLGLGGDAHTASLFPYTDVLRASKASVKAVQLPGQSSFRISMTAPLLNQARNIAFLTFGGGKSQAIFQVVKGDRDPEKYPAQLIDPEAGTVEWYTDQAAMRLLEEV